jgi:hypothetical protein
LVDVLRESRLSELVEVVVGVFEVRQVRGGREKWEEDEGVVEGGWVVKGVVGILLWLVSGERELLLLLMFTRWAGRWRRGKRSANNGKGRAGEARTVCVTTELNAPNTHGNQREKRAKWREGRGKEERGGVEGSLDENRLFSTEASVVQEWGRETRETTTGEVGARERRFRERRTKHRARKPSIDVGSFLRRKNSEQETGASANVKHRPPLRPCT